MGWVQPTTDLLKAIAPILQAIAWPIAVVIAVLVFRRDLRGMLARELTRLKAGPFEAEFERQRAQVEAEVGSAPSESPPPPNVSTVDELHTLALTSPTAAVLEAYARVEEALRRRVEGIPELQSNSVRRPGAVGLARLAAKHQRVPESAVRAVEGISVLRNMAAHGPRDEVTKEQALDYLSLVDAVLFSIDQPRLPD